jgi:predicted AAA+ superfamily ATPase
MSKDIFDIERIPPALDAYLHDTNPWWHGKPGPLPPRYRRSAFHLIRKKLAANLAPVVVVRGPRQVGKTTLQAQLIEEFIEKEKINPTRILRVQFDELPSLRGLSDPVLSIARWFENRILQKTFNESARKGEPVFVFLDEVQNLKDWAPQLKALVDHHTVRVVVTGSSSLRIAAGHDSLAGRIATVDLGTLTLREIAGLRFKQEFNPFLKDNGVSPLADREFWLGLAEHGKKNCDIRDQAFAAFSERGGYPIGHANPDVPWAELADQLNENVIKRAIQHDLRIGDRGRKRDENLLEEVFRLACRYAGQSPRPAVFVQEAKQSQDANVGWARILHYLKFLDAAMLIRLIQPMELRLKRKKGSSKICLCDHALRASWLQEQVPLTRQELQANPELATMAGHIAESITGYYLAGTAHLQVSHFPERSVEPEVDFVLTVGTKRIPVELKYRRRIDPHGDTVGLRAFLEKTANNAPFGVLVGMEDDITVHDPRILTISLPSLLLLR